MYVDVVVCAELSVIFESRKLSKVYVQSHYNWHSLCMNVSKLYTQKHLCLDLSLETFNQVSITRIIIQTFSSSSLLVRCFFLPAFVFFFFTQWHFYSLFWWTVSLRASFSSGNVKISFAFIWKISIAHRRL